MLDQPTGQTESAEKDAEGGEGERKAKARSDALSGIAWAAVLIWAGLVFLVSNVAPAMFAGREPWPVIFVGAGVIFLLEALVRTVRPEYQQRSSGGAVVFGVILIAIGLGDQVGWGTIRPIALIVVGVALLATTILRRR